MIKLENKQNDRFYYIHDPFYDIFGNRVLLVTRGGVNVSVHLCVEYGDLEKINKKIEALVKRRLRHGYVLVA